MRLVAAITLALSALTLAVPAHASRGHHHSHHHSYSAHHHRGAAASHRNHTHSRRDAGAGAVVASNEGGRPRDCWGIPWCGCFLKHFLHIPADIAHKLNLNLALNWLHLGEPATRPAKNEVAVWNHGGGHGHVGVIASDHPDRFGRWLVTSGNDGHAVRTRWRSVVGARFRIVSL